MTGSDFNFLAKNDGAKLAYSRLEGKAPQVVFLSGFRSDMTGTKAVFLEAACRRRGRAFLRFDYRGHGASSGRFEDGTISSWLEDTLAIIDEASVAVPLLLVGSSMGGWLALLAALRRPERVAGLIGIAAAPDFTSRLMEPALGDAYRREIEASGIVRVPSAYGEPLPITRALLEDGRRHRLLDGPIALACPVHLLHGRKDPDVPWRMALDLAARLESAPVTVDFIEDGDHRLSRDEDLARLDAIVDRMARAIDGSAQPDS